ncbi:MAG TPA: DUF4395 domain-containing protein [Dinghuibacter sp.]|jgi:hypothetical protein|uniref:DUF4395 domain-containing protein n=1 Tax=Dinghuibacter sp. TaxID=2024697 RepID=UPI002B6BE9E5|nr:DUF4395 domain-containing protein [Dinghuibacter sp.]HTJ13326.1 DUF4395 domain-containing protein [Dinghuibacter sp.]
MPKTIRFGESVPGYDIRVLNEREIRAAAGLFFVATLVSFLVILFTDNFVPVKYVLTIFFLDFAVRVFISPRLAPSLVIGRFIVRRQTPEYVGAAQKKFAWVIGLVLSATMFTFLVIVNAYSPITGITCLVCLIFLYFESSFGICLGCKVYSLVYRRKAQYCPGEVCNAKQPIQRTSGSQWLMVALLIAVVVLIAVWGNGYFKRTPHYLFEKPAK